MTRMFRKSVFFIAAAIVAALGVFPKSASAQVMGQANNAALKAAPGATQAAAPAPAPAPGLHGFLASPEATGDWGGLRTRLKEEAGTTIGASFTQFFSWVPTLEDTEDYQYGNKLDVIVATDLSRVAWGGLSVTGHVEMRAGDAPLLSGGTLIPTNTAMLLPAASGTKARLSNLSFTQILNPHVAVSVGRFNTVDLYSAGKAFTGGGGIDRFMNISTVAPLLDMRTVPPVAEGVMFAFLRGAEVAASAGIIESTDDGFFANGATVLWNVALPVEIMSSQPGHFSVGGAFSSTVANSLDQNPWVFIPALGLPKEPEQGAWTINFTGDQALMEDATDPSKKLGVFGMLGFSDANPSVFQPYAFIGFGGNVLIRGRTNDTFGATYFYGGVSNDLIRSVEPFLRLRDEQGGEFFYNFKLAGWTSLTADLQYVDPFAVGSKTRTFFSLRWKVNF